MLPKAAPQVILMDINLPEPFGHRMHRAHQGTAAVGAGGDDHGLWRLRKGFQRACGPGPAATSSSGRRRSGFLQAIREVHAGGVPMSSEIARKVLGAFREPAPAPAEDQNLSRREQEVLELLSQGCSNKEIADKLSISIETVTWHLRHIYSKLHVRSRTQAALKFLGRHKGM